MAPASDLTKDGETLPTRRNAAGVAAPGTANASGPAAAPPAAPGAVNGPASRKPPQQAHDDSPTGIYRSQVMCTQLHSVLQWKNIIPVHQRCIYKLCEIIFTPKKCPWAFSSIAGNTLPVFRMGNWLKQGVMPPPALSAPAAPGVFARAASPRRSRHAPPASAPLVVATVGLPARSKTTLAHRLARFLAWTGELAEAFTVSDYRRKLMERYDNHNLFRADNSEAMEIRTRSAAMALEDAVEWLRAAGTVAVLDGTHATRAARRQLRERVVERLGWRLLFVECVCDDDAILERNIQEILHNSPDYRDMGREKAEDDFRKKIAHYLEQYEPVAAKSEGISVIRYVNDGESVTALRVAGHLEAQVLSFLSCFKPCPKTLYFSRHGESEYNILGRIGGDANLSPRGQAYGRALAQRITELHLPSLHVWTSQLRRTKQTAQGIGVPMEHLAALNELDAGVCEGLTYEEMQERFPQEFAWRDQDKLRYRYPWGESYIDIMSRIHGVLLDLEGATEEVLVVSHQAVLRCVLGYFLHKMPEELPYLDVPLHTLIKLTSDGYNFNIEFFKLPVECVDTYRRQPKNCSTDRTTQDALLTVPSHFDSLSLWESKDIPKNLPLYIEQH